MESLASRLNKFLNEQKKATFVFDIDSTIFNVSPRNQAIYDLFTSTKVKKGDLTLSDYRLSAKDWGIEPYFPFLEKIKLSKEAKAFWKRHFFAGTFLLSDEPYPQVIDFIQRLYNLGHKVMYLTGRDDHRMRQGTLKQLKYWNLPSQENLLITKPHKSHIDQTYKREQMQQILLSAQGAPVVFFDNEPVVFKNCQFEEHSNYLPIFIESTHSNRIQPSRQWVSLNAFSYKDVLKVVLP